MITCDNAGGASPNRAAARSKIFCVASAVSGVFSDGFQITGSPHTSASAAFQHHTATGKLKAVMTPTDTERDATSRIMRVARPLGRDRQTVELSRQTDREVADVDHLLHFAETFLQDLAGLERHQRAEAPLRRAQFLAEQAHQFAAPRRGDRSPGRNAATARAIAAVTSAGS